MRKILIIAIIGMIVTLAFAQENKWADLAGTWYPRSEKELRTLLEGYFSSAKPQKIAGDILAIIVPHAGIQFSGPVAAYGYKTVRDRGFRTVVIIGFNHRKYFDGIAIYGKGGYQTPLGTVLIDDVLAQDLISQHPKIVFLPELFDEENSVELEIPFVQFAMKDAKIVPIAFGSQSYNDALILADALAKTLKDRRDVLVVASTDLSHYHPYDEAKSIDANTIATLQTMNSEAFYNKARQGACELCGIMPVTATMLLAERLGYAKLDVLQYANSGDTFGDKSRVVGYLSAVISKGQRPAQGPEPEKKGDTEMLVNNDQRQKLLQIARESIVSYVRDGKKKVFQESDPVLNQPMGAFVTLHENGELRGCIGNMVGRGPLYQTVADMAIEAATGDPRFTSLSPEEIGKIDIEVSVLSPLKRVKSADEINIPGHGVLVRRGFQSGVYLPQVATETGWSKEQFLTSLCGHKAGMAQDAWKDPQTELYVFTAEVFGEKE